MASSRSQNGMDSSEDLEGTEELSYDQKCSRVVPVYKEWIMEDSSSCGESKLVSIHNIESQEGHSNKKRDRAKKFFASLKGRKTWSSISSKSDKTKVSVKDEPVLATFKSATLPARRTSPPNSSLQEKAKESGSATLQRKFKDLFKLSSSDSVVVVDSGSDEEMSSSRKESDEYRDSGVDVSLRGETSGDDYSREVKLALGPSMRDVGKLLSSGGRLNPTPLLASSQNSFSDDEEERLSSRPPLPLPPEATKRVAPPSADPPAMRCRGGKDDDDDDGLYERITSSRASDRGGHQKAHAQLQAGLKDLARYGWYWGPISRLQAEERLEGLPNGAFLVRDSADDRYMLSLSFRSEGRTLHSRIEYSHCLFSFYTFPDADNDGYPTVAELIQHAMSFSQDGIFCFSRARNDTAPTIPVRLTQPASRFTKVRSLQDHCRFTIRQVTRFDQLRTLPLPRNLGDFLEESPFSTDTR